MALYLVYLAKPCSKIDSLLGLLSPREEAALVEPIITILPEGKRKLSQDEQPSFF
jgi:hypothetical protein